MKNNFENIDFLLLLKYLSNETSETEKNEVENWIQSDEQNKIEFENIKKLHSNSEKVKYFEEIDIQKDWEIVEKGFKKQKNGKVLKMDFLKKIAALIILLFTISSILYYTIIKKQNVEYFTFSTQQNEKLEIQLPDSSKIFLNENSVLSYNSKFNNHLREIEFSGEAFFEISKNKDKPFIISVNETEIKVLGTSFYIAESDSIITVSVSTGLVAFYLKTNEKEIVKISKNESAEFLKTSMKIEKIEIQNPNYLSWKTGIFTFDKTDLKTVITDLQSFYGFDYEFKDSKTEKLKFTSVFDNQKLEDIILELELVLDISIKQTENKLFIKKN